MDWWTKVAEELEAVEETRAKRRPNAVSPDALRRFRGLTIETSHRIVPPREGPPAAQPLPPAHFHENGHLLDSKESFLSRGRKGKW